VGAGGVRDQRGVSAQTDETQKRGPREGLREGKHRQDLDGFQTILRMTFGLSAQGHEFFPDYSFRIDEGKRGISRNRGRWF